jgi:outer membrane protein assembly factor BamB
MARFGPVTVAGGSVFLVSDQNDLVRLDAATGATLWEVDLPLFVDPRPRRREGIFAHYGPLLAGGRLIVASSDAQLRFFDPASGALTGSLPFRQAPRSSRSWRGGRST